MRWLSGGKRVSILSHIKSILSFESVKCGDDLRLFLFQTAFGSGAAAGRPFAPAPLTRPVLATSLGRADADEAEVRLATARVGEALSPGLATPGVPAALAARKVLLTETDLNVVGFLAVDDVRTCPLSSPSLFFAASTLEVSVSDPPLMLGSAEFTRSSTISAMCLFDNSSGEPEVAVPFTEGGFEPPLCKSLILGAC